MKTALTVIITIASLIVLGTIIIFTGISDVSAAKRDSALTRWVFSTARDNSIEHHAKGIEVPPLGDSAQVVMGFEHYEEMCVTCHGAPGVDRSEIGKGLNPHGPNLAKSIGDLSDAELFWITKNGIKMTGMPAFGKTHSDDKLWAITAFVKKLPAMTPEQYQAYKDIYGEEGEEMDMDMGDGDHDH